MFSTKDFEQETKKLKQNMDKFDEDDVIKIRNLCDELIEECEQKLTQIFIENGY